MPIHMPALPDNIQEKIAFLQKVFLSDYNESDNRRLDGILTFNSPELKKSKGPSPLIMQIRHESKEYIKIKIYAPRMMPTYKVKQLSKFAENPAQHVILLDQSLTRDEIMSPLLRAFGETTLNHIPFNEIKKVFSSKAILHEIYTAGIQDALPLVISQSNLADEKVGLEFIKLIVKNI